MTEAAFLMMSGPHFWLRGVYPADWLASQGVRTEVYPFLTGPQGMCQVMRRPRRPWALHALFEPNLEPLIRLTRDGLVVCLDDDYWHAPDFKDGSLSKATAAGLKNVTALLRAADTVVVTTEPLVEVARRFNRNVEIIPNALAGPFPRVGTHTWPNVRIGWGGSATHEADLELLREPLSQVLGANVTMVFMGYAPKWADGHPHIEVHRAPTMVLDGRTTTVMADHPVYLELLARLQLDIFVAPLADTRYNDARSAVKALEAFAVGLPVIASNVGPYRRELSDGETALLVDNTTREWVTALRSLMESMEGRSRLAVNGRRFLDRFGTMEATGLMWRKVLGV